MRCSQSSQNSFNCKTEVFGLSYSITFHFPYINLMKTFKIYLPHSSTAPMNFAFILPCVFVQYLVTNKPLQSGYLSEIFRTRKIF